MRDRAPQIVDRCHPQFPRVRLADRRYTVADICSNPAPAISRKPSKRGVFVLLGVQTKGSKVALGQAQGKGEPNKGCTGWLSHPELKDAAAGLASLEEFDHLYPGSALVDEDGSREKADDSGFRYLHLWGQMGPNGPQG